MRAYVYRAALLCEPCGKEVCQALKIAGHAPANTYDESTYDSDDYPKGPYSQGGGEADTPQHCDKCGVFLKNPLTSDGYDYVRQAIEAAEPNDADENEIVNEWSAYYGIR